MHSKLTRGTVLAASAAAGVLLAAGPATAQTAADFVPDCASGVLAYAPGLTAGAASNANPAVAENIVLSSGEGSFDPGSLVTATFNGTPLPEVPVVGTNGSATVLFTVPSLDAGTYVVIFTGSLNGAPNVVGVCFTVSAAAIGGVVEEPAVLPEESPEPAAVPIAGVDEEPAQRPAALPFTGSVELLAVVGLGAGLIAMGAGTVVVARRRHREDIATA